MGSVNKVILVGNLGKDPEVHFTGTGRAMARFSVATSGDTGGAVGCAAENRSSVRATILFPHGRVSPFQERQLTCWGDNVQALDVDGDFDDCQHLVKAAFADAEMAAEHRLTSANSINFGRRTGHRHPERQSRPRVLHIACPGHGPAGRTGRPCDQC